MSSKQSSGFFWPSYTDLMTSLFFIMLVLYVLTVVKLQIQKRATEEQLKKIEEIQTAIESLPKEYFEYQEDYKRFVLTKPPQYDDWAENVPPQDMPYLKKVGQSLVDLIERLKNQDRGGTIKYLVVIEGRGSIGSGGQEERNYSCSYQRAKNLYRFWQNEGIDFDPKVCEIVFAGSGVYGVGRFRNDKKNQTFIIQIVPKIGKIKTE